MALKGASAVIAEEAKAAGPVARPGGVQSRLPLAEAGALAVELERQPTRAAAVAEARRRGRPKGSRNRRSEELIRFVLSRHSHPMLALAQIWSRPIESLRAEVGCTALEAVQLQVRAAAEALPYFESKKPVAVQIDSRVIQLSIDTRGADGVAADAAPWERALAAMALDAEAQQNQEDSE